MNLTGSSINLKPPNLALQIRNLSPKFPYQDRNELLYGLGATSVHNHPYFSVAFFSNEHSCQMVIRLLHQRLLNHRRLRVEFAKTEQIQRLPSHLVCDTSLTRKIKQDQIDAFRDHVIQLKSVSEADENSTKKIFFSNLNHSFPKATTVIVNRIKQQLLNNEQFYHQVLLLMIQFGLYPPFDNEQQSIASIPLPPINDEESEIETDLNQSDFNQSQAPQFELKRRQRKRKRLKTGFLGEQTASSSKKPKPTTTIKEIFENDEKINKNKCKKFSINISANVDNKPNDQIVNVEQPEGFGLLRVHDKPKSSTSLMNDNSFDVCLLTKQDLISDYELVRNRIFESDWSKYAVFNNYSAGTQSHRLYVKNIHRKVTLKDLYRLFARYIDLDNSDHLNNFGIIYMEKGRMREQAFVTYPKETQAQNALSSVNGYVFYEKPIVVTYGHTRKLNNHRNE